MAEKSPKELYDERIKRIKDTVALKVPDRVPVFGPYQKYPYAFGGITLQQAMNDYPAARAACHKFLDYFQPDVDFGPIFAYPAPAMETLGWKAFKWPGHGLAENSMYQYVDDEYLKAEEYDEFIQDPSDFMMRKWAPRQFSALQGFEKMVPWRRFMWSGWMNFGFFADPAMQETLKLAIKSGEQMNEWWGSQAQYWGEIAAKGYPLAFAGWDWPPFDILGDTLRGTHNILADMRRRPSKLHEALEVATRIFVEYGSGSAGAPLPFAWVWVHKATREFMSDAQFKEFYWPFIISNYVGVLLPLLVVGIAKLRTITNITLAAVVVIIALWLNRYLIVIPTLQSPYLPIQDSRPEWSIYQSTWVEWSLTAAGIAMFCLLFTLASKFIPIVNVAGNTQESNPDDVLV